MSFLISRFALIVGMAALMAAQASAQAQDRVRRVDGRAVRGKVVAVSPTEVTVKQVGGGNMPIGVNEIDSIVYGGEPSELAKARANVLAQRFEEALESLEKLDPSSVTRSAVRQDIEFYKAYCNARLALSGTKKVTDAGGELFLFIRNHGESYHAIEANELLGNLLMAAGKETNAARAQGYYKKVLSAADWNDAKLRVGVLIGRALLAQKKFGEAAKRFDTVLKLNAEDEEGLRQQQFARLGKGLSVALGGDAKTGLQAINEVLQQTAEEDASDAELLAHGYRARALASLSAGDKKQALFDFLHIHLLYNAAPETHAESLYQLSLLWKEMGETARAKEAGEMLKQRYPESHWIAAL